jgi:hypothetical protein
MRDCTVTWRNLSIRSGVEFDSALTQKQSSLRADAVIMRRILQITAEKKNITVVFLNLGMLEYLPIMLQYSFARGF